MTCAGAQGAPGSAPRCTECQGGRPAASHSLGVLSAFTSGTQCHTLSLSAVARRTAHACARVTEHAGFRPSAGS
ncbi:predicted protein [Streptomyces viridosporus ATCC 14672]|uniref:Predicted protein n=1 Tax=Streptomyces viridosporus (strain ATCC 14672 / DSM 40746 / JCM 4963 / KCTC 9882 / NRRL B-12104 / FH 1290) TaxID=566461 RepID=D5ZYI9_STRV1|nr:predicted protein [Streptomyces viridosporus ATCC 14672]